jgi:lipid-binding SYLF domain-containing protein
VTELMHLQKRRRLVATGGPRGGKTTSAVSHCAKLVFVVACSFAASGACAREQPAISPSAGASPQQAIVDRSLSALISLRDVGDRSVLSEYLKSAHGVLIFPRLVKAGLVFGGEGGNGVLLVRAPDGAWSAPAFYSIGAGSVGLQIGYQETSVVLVLMTRRAVLSAIGRGITLGTDVSVAAGTIGDAGEARRQSASRDVYYFAATRGVFAGLSLDGAVVSSRAKHDVAYYGPHATARAIVLDRRFDHRGTAQLKAALGSK